MTAARATLMTLVQCRPLWFWHIWGLVICLTVLVTSGTRTGAVFSLLTIPLWVGVIATSLYKDFLTKPFSFCAPRHMRVWRRTLFEVAVVVAGVCALASLLTPSTTPAIAAMTAWQTFVLCMAMFMAATLVTAATANVGFLPAMITGLLIISFNDNLAEYIRVSVNGALLANPVVTTLACAVILFFAWRELGAKRFARRMCGEPFLGLHSTFDGNRTAAYQAERKMRRMRRSPGSLMITLETFFMGRMRTFSGHPTLRSLWGALYVQTGKTAPATVTNFIALFLLLTVLTLLLGYYHPHRAGATVSGSNLMIFILCAINAEYRINPYAGLLLNVSRKNRFWSLMLSALAQWMVVAVSAAVLTAVSVAGGRFLSDLTIYRGIYSYSPIHPMAFFIFAPMIPFYFLSQVLFPKQHVISIMVIAIIGTLVFFGGGHRLLELSAPAIILIQVMSWLPFVLFMQHHCYSRDLKLNGQ